MFQYQGVFVWWVYLSVVLLLNMSHKCKVTLQRKSKRKKEGKKIKKNLLKTSRQTAEICHFTHATAPAGSIWLFIT